MITDITNYKLNLKKKYTQERIREILSSFKQIWFSYITKEQNQRFLTMVSFSRLDIIPSLHKKYTSETYRMNIEKGKEETFDQFSKDLLIDDLINFHSVDEIIDYLDKKGYLKKEEWIITKKLIKNENKK